MSFRFGAGGGTRTHTVSPPTDFESVTSTNTRSRVGYWFIIKEGPGKFKHFFAAGPQSSGGTAS